MQTHADARRKRTAKRPTLHVTLTALSFVLQKQARHLGKGSCVGMEVDVVAGIGIFQTAETVPSFFPIRACSPTETSEFT